MREEIAGVWLQYILANKGGNLFAELKKGDIPDILIERFPQCVTNRGGSHIVKDSALDVLGRKFEKSKEETLIKFYDNNRKAYESKNG